MDDGIGKGFADQERANADDRGRRDALLSAHRLAIIFTTKPTGKGNTGLGLSLSYDIITQEHGGALTVEGTKPAPAKAGGGNPECMDIQQTAFRVSTSLRPE